MNTKKRKQPSPTSSSQTGHKIRPSKTPDPAPDQGFPHAYFDTRGWFSSNFAFVSKLGDLWLRPGEGNGKAHWHANTVDATLDRITRILRPIRNARIAPQKIEHNNDLRLPKVFPFLDANACDPCQADVLGNIRDVRPDIVLARAEDERAWCGLVEVQCSSDIRDCLNQFTNYLCTSLMAYGMCSGGIDRSSPCLPGLFVHVSPDDPHKTMYLLMNAWFTVSEEYVCLQLEDVSTTRDEKEIARFIANAQRLEQQLQRTQTQQTPTYPFKVARLLRLSSPLPQPPVSPNWSTPIAYLGACWRKLISSDVSQWMRLLVFRRPVSLCGFACAWNSLELVV